MFKIYQGQENFITFFVLNFKSVIVFGNLFLKKNKYFAS